MPSILQGLWDEVISSAKEEEMSALHLAASSEFCWDDMVKFWPQRTHKQLLKLIPCNPKEMPAKSTNMYLEVCVCKKVSVYVCVSVCAHARMNVHMRLFITLTF